MFGPVFGDIQLSLFIDEEEVVTNFSLGTAVTTSTGCGTRILGSFVLGQETNDTGTDTSGVTNDYRWKKIARPNEGTRIQFEFSGSGANESAQIEKFKIYYNQNVRKKDRTRRLS